MWDIIDAIWDNKETLGIKKDTWYRLTHDLKDLSYNDATYNDAKQKMDLAYSLLFGENKMDFDYCMYGERVQWDVLILPKDQLRYRESGEKA